MADEFPLIYGGSGSDIPMVSADICDFDYRVIWSVL